MISYGLQVVIALALLAGAIPYAARIRHPDQKPLAAYLIFVFVFAIAAAVIFTLLAWLITTLGFGSSLEHPVAAAVFLFVVFAPALALATWQARKPPYRGGPPA